MEDLIGEEYLKSGDYRYRARPENLVFMCCRWDSIRMPMSEKELHIGLHE